VRDRIGAVKEGTTEPGKGSRSDERMKEEQAKSVKSVDEGAL